MIDQAGPFRFGGTGLLVEAEDVSLHQRLACSRSKKSTTSVDQRERLAVIEVGSGAVRLQIMELGQIHNRHIGSEHIALNLLDVASPARAGLVLLELERILTAYRAKAARSGAKFVRVIGTAGARLLARRTPVIARLGIDILSEPEEARLSFIGAMNGWQHESNGRDVLVIDQGQGSLELAEGTPSLGMCVKRSTSLPLGARAVSEIYPHSDSSQFILSEQLRSTLSGWLARAADQRSACATIIGSTATRLGWEAVKRRPTEKYAREKVHGATFNLESLRHSLENLRVHTGQRQQKRQSLASVDGRDADFVANLLVICEIASLAGVSEIRVSTTGTRQGALLEMASAFKRASYTKAASGSQ